MKAPVEMSQQWRDVGYVEGNMGRGGRRLDTIIYAGPRLRRKT